MREGKSCGAHLFRDVQEKGKRMYIQKFIDSYMLQQKVMLMLRSSKGEDHMEKTIEVEYVKVKEMRMTTIKDDEE